MLLNILLPSLLINPPPFTSSPSSFHAWFPHNHLRYLGMKFRKRLKKQVQESWPAWQDKFLSYKELNKLVRLISSAPRVLNKYGKVEAEFVYLLNNEIEKVKLFFMEQEEDFYIRHEELQLKIKRVTDTWGPNGSQLVVTEYKKEMEKIRRNIVNFHGEMVLLENYSNITYTGLAKILKKYDRRTGGLLCSPFIKKVLQQPFFITDLVSNLVKQCENTIDQVFPAEEEESRSKDQYNAAGEGIFRNTVSALLTMQEIRRESSTYNQFSQPPVNLLESDIIQAIQLNYAVLIL